MNTTSPTGKLTDQHSVPLPAIPEEWKRETRPEAEKVEEMLLKMGFKPLSPETRSQLIASGHYGMPQD